MLACPSPGAVRCFSLRSDAVTHIPRFHPFSSPCLAQGRCLCVSHLGSGWGHSGSPESCDDGCPYS